MDQEWVIIRTYHHRDWAEEDAVELNAHGIETTIDEIPEEERNEELEVVGWINLLVRYEVAEEADEFLQQQDEKREAWLAGDTPGARKTLIGGVACMLGMLVALSPNGGPVESIAWLTVGLGAFQFMRGIYQQREEEAQLMESHFPYRPDEEEDEEDSMGF